MNKPLAVARNPPRELAFLPNLTNRHGAITGLAGSSKRVARQTRRQMMPQALSAIGVPGLLLKG